MQRYSFLSVRSEFYEDASESIQNQESIISFLRQEAKREMISGSKMRAELYSRWIRKLGERETEGKISKAMGKDIPQNDAMIIASFEEAGKPREGFDIAKASAERSAELFGIYKKASIYPAMSIMAVIGVASFLVGAFPKAGDPAKWPVIAKMSYDYMFFLSSNAMLIIALMFGLAFIISSEMSPLSFSRLTGSARAFMDKKIPPWSMYKESQAATMLLLLAALIQSGLSTTASLRTISGGSGAWMQSYISRIIRRIGDRNNEQVVFAFKNTLFNDRIYFRLESSSLRGGFDRAIIRIATTSFKKILENANKQAFMMQQLFIAFAGGSLLLMVSGMIAMGFALGGNL